MLNEDRQREDANLLPPLNVGSCGLHVVHRAFCKDCQSTDWKIDGFLRVLWYLFHDSPARRGDFTAVTGSTVFPLKFCATRWVEDEMVAQRAIEIWPNIEWYIAHVFKETKSKHPTSASFTTVQKATKDPLLVAKVAGFVYIVMVLKPFILKYQTHAPVMMFLGEDLQDTCQKLMQKFVKTSILDSVDTAYKAAHLDVLDTKNHRSASDIDIGLATKEVHCHKSAVLTNLVKKKVVNERGVLIFKMECVQFSSNFTHKILERNPLKYILVRTLFCLNPKKMAEVPEECSKAIEAVLTKLVEAKWRASSEADYLLEQYRSFLQFVRKGCDSDFKNNRERVETFLYVYISDKKELQPLWKVFRLLLTITQPGIS